jgi:hypothetical protein
MKADIVRRVGPSEPQLVEELLDQVGTHIQPLVMA